MDAGDPAKKSIEGAKKAVVAANNDGRREIRAR